MDTVLPIVCLLIGIALPVGILFLVIRRGIRQLAVASAYREVAQQLGLEVDTRGISLRGHLGERRLWVGEVLETHGLSREQIVRGVVSFERPLGLGLHVFRRGRARPFARKKAYEARTGDADIDRLFTLLGDEESRVRTLFTSSVRQNLHALSRLWKDIIITDEDVQVWLDEPIANPGELHALIDHMFRLADVIETARRDIPAPAPLEPVFEQLRKTAERAGLAYEPWLPGWSGEIEGRRVLATIQRAMDGYASTLSIRFGPHSPIGLLLRPQLEPDGYWSVGQDIHIGDELFDRAFVIKGWDPALIRERLSTQVRASLMTLRELGTVIVDDRGISLRSDTIDSYKLLEATQTAIRCARDLGW